MAATAPYNVTPEERRRFSNYLWDSPREMLAGALLGFGISVLLFTFWLAFGRLHVYGYWGDLKADLVWLDALALCLAVGGTGLLKRRDGAGAVYWCVCAVLAGIFAQFSGLFGLPRLPQATGFFIGFHVLPVLPYSVGAGVLQLREGSRRGLWWLLFFLPAALAAPLLAVTLRPAGQPPSPAVWIACGVLWAAALAARFALFRSPGPHVNDGRYRKSLREIGSGKGHS